MANVQLNELQVGMVLAADAVCLNGRILLRSGATLNDKHLKMFRAWGVVAVDIEGIKTSEMQDKKFAVIDPQIIEGVRLNLDERFCHADKSHPLIAELYRCALERAVKEGQP